MRNNAVCCSVHIVVTVDVDHYSRSSYFLYFDNALHDHIIPALVLVYRNKLQSSVNAVLLYGVSEVGVRLYLAEHERKTVTHRSVGYVDEPVIAECVLTDTGQIFAVSVKKLAGIAAWKR